jgi:hypothetical protein
MLWRGGCDGRVLRYGAGERHQQAAVLRMKIGATSARARRVVVSANEKEGKRKKRFFPQGEPEKCVLKSDCDWSK